MSFLGTFNHNLDAKGRLFIPARFREELGEEFVLFKSPDKCIFIYSNASFDELIEQVRNNSDTAEGRMQQRQFFLSAMNVSIDKQGRFTVPQDFIEYGGLKTEVVLMGSANRIELWDKAEFDKMNSFSANSSVNSYPRIRY